MRDLSGWKFFISRG